MSCFLILSVSRKLQCVKFVLGELSRHMVCYESRTMENVFVVFVPRLTLVTECVVSPFFVHIVVFL